MLRTTTAAWQLIGLSSTEFFLTLLHGGRQTSGWQRRRCWRRDATALAKVKTGGKNSMIWFLLIVFWFSTIWFQAGVSVIFCDRLTVTICSNEPTLCYLPKLAEKQEGPPLRSGLKLNDGWHIVPQTGWGIIYLTFPSSAWVPNNDQVARFARRKIKCRNPGWAPGKASGGCPPRPWTSENHQMCAG